MHRHLISIPLISPASLPAFVDTSSYVSPATIKNPGFRAIADLAAGPPTMAIERSIYLRCL